MFVEALKRLIHHCPLAEPFVIVETKKKDGFGWFSWIKSGFEIKIATDVDVSIQIDTLIHEWAHGLRIIKSPHGTHDDLFGIEWARCYRAVYANTGKNDDTETLIPPGSTFIFQANEKYGIPELVITKAVGL